MSTSARIRALADKQAIFEQMCRYIQAVDRCDLELLKSTFHHDGSVIFGIFDGNAHDFCDYDIPFIKRMAHVEARPGDGLERLLGLRRPQ